MRKHCGHTSAACGAYDPPMPRKSAVRRCSAVLIVSVGLLARPALAAPIDANPLPPGASSPVPGGAVPLSGVVVSAPSRTLPSIVSTYPAAGDVVAPGALVLKLTFDQRMNPESWRFDRGGDDRYPSCLARPRLLANEKTFVLLCTVGANGKFAIQMNGEGDGGFENQANQRAQPLLLQFSTKDGASQATIKDAMKSAGLKDEENPVMDKKPAAVALARPPAPPAP